MYLKPISGIEKAKRSRNIFTISKKIGQCEIGTNPFTNIMSKIRPLLLIRDRTMNKYECALIGCFTHALHYR